MTSNSSKLNAAHRALERIAPFHKSKNSMGDAVLIETYIEYKATHQASIDGLAFVSHNKSDFSIQTGDQRLPHEDLAEIFDGSKSSYFIDLAKALISIDPDFMIEVEMDDEWIFEPRSYTEILEVEEHLVEKIWYNRHMLRQQSIEDGKVRIIERSEFDIKNTQSTIVKDIWLGALKAAEAVKQKHGEDNLYFTDFEWGMVNGKLSALRWVIGDDWDNLDT